MTGEDPRAFGDDTPIGAVRGTRRQELGRRALNLLVAGIGIVLTAPVMLVIAVAIRVTSHGPIIFRQPRVGIDRRRTLGNPPEERRKEDAGGRLFTMYKFRTMYVRPIDPPGLGAAPGPEGDAPRPACSEPIASMSLPSALQRVAGRHERGGPEARTAPDLLESGRASSAHTA